MASQANAHYAAWHIERAFNQTNFANKENTKAEEHKKDFEFFLEQLLMLDLSQLGVTQTSRVYVGGISKSEKESVEGDGDRVEPRFFRGQFKNVEAMEPSATSASS